MAAWTAAALPSKLNFCAVPISRFQSQVLRTLAAQRNPESYIAGGVPLNRDGPRFSADIDIFHDSDARLDLAVEADAAALDAAGYHIAWDRARQSRREAIVSLGPDRMKLEWATDTAFRFFPAQPDPLFGYVLHPIDLAANKASAAADRRVPRDIVDLITIHQNILPLGPVLSAAVGKFPGVTPEEMLADITRHSRFSVADFQALATEFPIDAADLHRQVRAMIQAAEKFLSELPSDAVGFVFMDGDRAVQPNLQELGLYRRNPGGIRGVWPSSPAIETAMLQHHDKLPG